MKNFTPSPKEHTFFNTMAVVMVAAIVTGFSSTYLPKVMGDTVQLPRIIHVHAFVFVLWLAFFLFQVTLVLRNKITLHTRLGKWGVMFSLIMLGVGCAASLEAAKLGHRGIPGAEFPNAEGFLLLNFSSLFVFVSLTLLGWINRHNAPAHKRFMLMANVGGIAPPGVARLPFLAGSTPAIAIAVMAFVLAGPVYDMIRYRKIHLAYLPAVLIVSIGLPPVVLALSGTSVWKELAGLLMR